MQIFVVSVLLVFYCINSFLTEDVPGQAAGAQKSAVPVTHSKLPGITTDALFATGPVTASQFVHLPKNLVRGLKEAMEEARQKQETLIKHLECSISPEPARCDEKSQEAPPVKLDWTTYVADDQTPYLLEISHFFKDNPVDLPLEIVAPIMQMFHGAVTEIYIKQRYVSNLFEQAVCSINHTCEKSKLPKVITLKEGEDDRLIPQIFSYLGSLFRPSVIPAPFVPTFNPPAIFQGQKPCKNDTLSGTFDNGWGFYYSHIIQYSDHCNSTIEHTNNK